MAEEVVNNPIGSFAAKESLIYHNGVYFKLENGMIVNPRRNVRREAGALSGRQWVKLRKRLARQGKVKT